MSPRAEVPPPSAAGNGADADAAGPNGEGGVAGQGPALTGDPEEIELKLAVDEIGAIRTLLRRPPPAGIAGFTAAGPLRAVTCIDRYYDTTALGGRLSLAGLRARIREQDGALTLGVKASISRDGAVSRRVELEGPAGRDLDPAGWPLSEARDRLIAALDGAPLLEIAALRQHRLQRDFARDGTTVEVSLDRLGAVRGRRVLDRRIELEAELHGGDAGLLQPLAAALEALRGMGPALGSKLAFALAARTAADGARTQ